MKRVTRVQTFDGLVHDDQKAAQRHLDKLYADLLCSVARELSNQKYMFVTSYIDEHLDDFQRLRVIKADMSMEPAEDDN